MLKQYKIFVVNVEKKNVLNNLKNVVTDSLFH